MTGAGRRILFIVPYRARDLDGLALIAHHLERRYGHVSVLTNGNGIEQKLLQHAPDAVVFDHLSFDFKADQARLAKSLGMKTIVLPTEGFFQSAEEPRRIAGKLQGVAGLVDCQFTWGNLARSAILEEGLASPGRVHAIGCPRFDFYREPYLSLMGDRQEFLASLGVTRVSGPTLVWATNTTYLTEHARDVLRRHMTRGNLPETELRALLDDEQVQYREHSRVIIELAHRHPDWNVVVKIHPAEYIDPYFAVQRQAVNIHLAFDAPIFKFLCHCDVLLQRGCTTASEAWILGKPVLELEIGRYSTSSRADFVAGNQVVRSFQETEKAILRSLEGAPIAVEQQGARGTFLQSFYGSNDGRASERCAEWIDRLVSPPSYGETDHRATQDAASQAYGVWRRQDDARAINRLKDLLGVRRDSSLRFWTMLRAGGRRRNRGLFVGDPEITPEMVEERRQRYDRVLGNAAERAPLLQAESPPVTRT